MTLMLVIVVLSRQVAIDQPVMKGVASYYTNLECPGYTASGEKYDDTKYTIALRRTDYGKKYLVVANNGKNLVVRHNDYGPKSKKRICDLSKAAMRVLNPMYKEKGLLEIKLYELPFSYATMLPKKVLPIKPIHKVTSCTLRDRSPQPKKDIRHGTNTRAKRTKHR